MRARFTSAACAGWPMQRATTRNAFAAAASAIMAGLPALPDAARAQPLEYDALEQLFSEPVTTSVTGSPQRQSDAPATMEIITAEQIRRSGARDIPGVLQRVVGVDVMRWAHDHASVAVRGYNQPFSPRLLVLVDGRQVYADHYGYTPWPTLPVELGAIRQIEIVKGPSSALFGFNAVGGVVNIVTSNPLHERTRTATVEAGTQDLRGGSAVSTVELGESGTMTLSAGTRRGDDFSSPIRQPGTSAVRRGNGRDTARIDARFSPREGFEAAFEATYSDTEYVELSPIYTLSHAMYESRSLKGQFSADTGLGLVQGTLYRNSLEGDVSPGVAGAAPLAINNEVTVASLEDVFKVGTDHTVRVSAEYRDNGADTTPVEGGHVHYDVAALGGMWHWRITPSVSLTNAIRYDRLSLGRRGTTPPGYGLENADWDRTLTERSLNTGVVWQAGDADTLRLMIGRGVQLPSLFTFGAGVFAFPPVGHGTGVPSIEPSVVTNYELGWDRTLGAIDANLRVSLFRGATRDVISIAGGSRPEQGLVATAANLGDSDTAGLEVTISGTAGEDWRWGASYVHQQVDDELAPDLSISLVDYESTTPEHTLEGNLGWSRGPWEADATVRYRSRADGIRGVGGGALSATRVPVSDYVAVDGRLAYGLTDHATLSLSGRNLAHDEQQQTSAAAVERTLLARLEFTF